MKKVFLYILFFLNGLVVFSQDPNFTLFYNNPTYYNSAMTAINRGFTCRLNARNQWAPVPGEFSTYSATLEGEFFNQLAMGLNVFTDVAGEGMLRTTGGSLMYAYCPIENSNHKLQFGMSGTYLNKSIDWQKLNFSDQYDEVYGKVYATKFLPPSSNNYSYLDLGTGIAYQYYFENKYNYQFKKFMTNVGAAMHHLNQPRDGYFSGSATVPIKSVIHARTQVLFGALVYSVAGIYELQNKFTTQTLGFNVQHRTSLNIGVWTRSGNTLYNQRFESLITSIGFIFPVGNSNNLRFTYSADFTLSKLRTASFGSHEVSLVFMIDDKLLFKVANEKKKRKNMFKCPSDFNGFN